MQVYKAIFKIIYKNLNQIIIYLGVFLFFAILSSKLYSNNTISNFSQTKINIAFINYDTDSDIVNGLKSYLNKNSNIIDIADNKQKLQDALFFRKVEYIIKVPKGFTSEFIAGKAVKLNKSEVPASTNSIYMDNIVNKYLNTASIYIKSLKSVSQKDIVKLVNKDLSLKTDVKVSKAQGQLTKYQRCQFFYNYLAYSMFAVLVLGVCCVMMVFNNSDLKKRCTCSPLKLKSFNIQMILGNLSFAVLTWAVMVLASFIMYRSEMFTVKGLLFILNSLVFNMAALSISYLVGNIVKSRGAMSAAANVVSLGSCFISGVFVPQYLLGKTVLRIASFTPTYWYVKANDQIANLVSVNFNNLMPTFTNMFIMIGFAIAILLITIAVTKQKRVTV